ncbi:M23 family metallopeptidase [Chlorobium phaeovibrioides]|uniref:M23 family metallopeptidase n=1 Tax=Chlorobium phaeovibrioides TaxID=1094 RepID=UPI000F82AB9A|nr:M23 family metallopeptidase [Chlorobium phaeovibrioides]RTY35844.1 M23 family metallopeptidase [Chlorobium phaeovibrioides]
MALRIPQAQRSAGIRRAIKPIGFILFFLLFFTALPMQLRAAEPPVTNMAPGTEQTIEQLIMQIEEGDSRKAAPAEGLKNSQQSPFLACVPNIRPVSGPVTSSFGARTHPIYKVRMFHTGVDFSAPKGSHVEATGDGTVAWSGYDRGYGQKVVINHGYGFTTLYAHLSKSIVRMGQRVRRGEIIGLVGSTGISTGPHLHYEVMRRQQRVDPAAYFFDAAHPEKFISNQSPAEEDNGSNS